MLSENFIKTMQAHLPGVNVRQYETGEVEFDTEDHSAVFDIDDLLDEATEDYKFFHRIYSAIQNFVETHGKDAIYTA